MVQLEPQFIATKFPGYFFNPDDNKLYSLKVDGILKPLSFYTPNHFNRIGTAYVKLQNQNRVNVTGGFYCSVKGKKRFYALEELQDLQQHEAVIPVKEAK